MAIKKLEVGPPTDNDLWEGQTLPGPMTGKVPAIGAVVEN